MGSLLADYTTMFPFKSSHVTTPPVTDVQLNINPHIRYLTLKQPVFPVNFQFPQISPHYLCSYLQYWHIESLFWQENSIIRLYNQGLNEKCVKAIE